MNEENGGGGMKRLVSVSLGVGLMVAIATSGFAYITQGEEEILRGLTAVTVKVERLRAEIEQDGLFASTLENDVELKLRLAGINVLSEEEGNAKPDTPRFYLFVDAFKHSEGYIYRIQVSLRESVMVLRTRTKIIATTMRIRDELGITPYLSEIRGEAQDLVDEFIRAWQTANRKKTEKR
jgi:hypothetical protein